MLVIGALAFVPPGPVGAAGGIVTRGGSVDCGDTLFAALWVGGVETD